MNEPSITALPRIAPTTVPRRQEELFTASTERPVPDSYMRRIVSGRTRHTRENGESECYAFLPGVPVAAGDSVSKRGYPPFRTTSHGAMADGEEPDMRICAGDIMMPAAAFKRRTLFRRYQKGVADQTFQPGSQPQQEKTMPGHIPAPVP